MPNPAELLNCRVWLRSIIDLLPVGTFVALGQIAWKSLLNELRQRGWHNGPMPRFGHGAQVELTGGRWLIGSYHPSQQTTFTGKLTEAMFNQVFAIARQRLQNYRGTS